MVKIIGDFLVSKGVLVKLNLVYCVTYCPWDVDIDDGRNETIGGWSW